MRIAVGYAFNFLNMHKVWCKTTAGDESILLFYQQIGFKVESTLVEQEFIEGQYVDKILLGMLRRDYKV